MKQQSKLSRLCGHYCLEYIFEYFSIYRTQKEKNMEKIKMILGSTPTMLKNILERHNLKVNLIKSNINEFKFPAILGVNSSILYNHPLNLRLSHFIVVSKVNEDNCIILDSHNSKGGIKEYPKNKILDALDYFNGCVLEVNNV